MAPRLISPHPSSNQSIAAVARGPIVYCVEDIDNAWVSDHFKSVLFDCSVALKEVRRSDIFSDEVVIGVQASDAARFIVAPEEERPLGREYNPLNHAAALKVQKRRKETLHFVPYFARANRDGKGMMRVGLRTILQAEAEAS
jgi:uncharacterized protein